MLCFCSGADKGDKSCDNACSFKCYVTLILFLLKSPLAAVFELSVCAGLITVIFISVISLTNPLSQDERSEARESMFKNLFCFLLS